MEPALKQRLIGASVLIALAVIFLPMLIKGPAPESGASDVPLELPPAPDDGRFKTQELPLVTPGEAPQGGAVGLQTPAGGADGKLPTVDAGAAAAPAPAAADAMLPATAAGGDYAVSFGSYATAADAARVVEALRAAQLPGYQETAASPAGRTVYRVRIGPYATRADAETARLHSARVRDDVGAKVVALDADAAAPTQAAPASASTAQPLAAAEPARPEPLRESKPAASAKATEPGKPGATPAPAKPASVASAPARPAASSVGFAVQLGAFANAADATKLRDRARAAGFSAFVEQVNTDKGALSRVRIGPVVSRAEADQLKAQVAARLGMSGIVRPHP